MAECGGWILSHGSLSALDKALDAEPCLNHRFLEQGKVLLQRKQENPAMRISKGDGFLQREQVSVEEKRTVGLKQPKRKFMTLEAYKKRFGAPDPSKIKSQKIGGVELQGIDIVNEEDEGVFEYIDQSSNAVSRVTDLSDPDLILSKDQNTVIFAAATKLMAPKEDPFVTLQSSSASPSGPASSVAGAGVTDGANAATGVDVTGFVNIRR